ncbi:MAG: hypothetical protein K2L31_03920 [Muribaculum sp.]|nr:hypothetical protein [Muribaculum sp.]
MMVNSGNAEGEPAASIPLHGATRFWLETIMRDLYSNRRPFRATRR